MIKDSYNLDDLLISNNRCLDYYDRVREFNNVDRIPLDKNRNPDKKIVKVIKDELKDINSKQYIRETFHDLVTKAIQKETFYDTHHKIELPYSVEVEKYLKQHKWLIPPFARLNNLSFKI